MYTLTRLTENPIVLLELDDRIDDKMINHMFMESVGYFQVMEGAACLVVDFEKVQQIDADKFAAALRIFQRTSPTFKGDAPVFYAFVGSNGIIEPITGLLEKMKFHIPVFKSSAEALSYLNLKVGGTYLRQSKNLKETDKLETLHIAGKHLALITSEIPALTNNVYFPHGGILRLKDVETRRVMLALPRPEMLIGRQDSNTSKPDIDLSMWGAFHKGVSRHHAKFILTEESILKLIDLGSSNGTQINGTDLEPKRPYTLRNGDEISFGVLTILIHFQDTMDADITPH